MDTCVDSGWMKVRSYRETAVKTRVVRLIVRLVVRLVVRAKVSVELDCRRGRLERVSDSGSKTVRWR